MFKRVQINEMLMKLVFQHTKTIIDQVAKIELKIDDQNFLRTTKFA